MYDVPDEEEMGDKSGEGGRRIYTANYGSIADARWLLLPTVLQSVPTHYNPVPFFRLYKEERAPLSALSTCEDGTSE